MVRTKHWWDTPLSILGYVILLAVTLMMVIPFIWMVSTSMKPSGSEFAYPPEILPSAIDFSNYIDLFTLVPFGRYFINTAIVTFFTVAGQLIVCSTAAYGFSRLKFMGRDTIFVIYLATMMIPFQITLIPLFLIIFHLGWVNTYQGLIVPVFSASSCCASPLWAYHRTTTMRPVSTAQGNGRSSRAFLCHSADQLLRRLLCSRSWAPGLTYCGRC